MTEPTSHTVDAPGAVIHYDVRGSDATQPPLLMFGSPMDATGFGTLAGHFADRTVVTYDPRGAGRSKRTDDATQTTPQEHADDLRRVITALGAGPVDIFATSGGAFNALALVERHPELVLTLVAHEPPAAQLLPDRDHVVAAMLDFHETYLASGGGPAMVKFIAMVGHKGEMSADYLDRPAPDPAMFGLPAEDDGTRDDPLMLNMIPAAHYRHDCDALRAASTRIVMVVGAESVGEIAHRGGVAVAERLGTQAVTFPSGHHGFLGGEFGMTGDPDAFAARLRDVLSAQD